ncbi:hypothetical protein Hanom_Chr03g00200641 [Helianthus anomalus]
MKATLMKTKKMTPAKAKQLKSIRSSAAKRSPASDQVTEQKTNIPCQAKLLSVHLHLHTTSTLSFRERN